MSTFFLFIYNIFSKHRLVFLLSILSIFIALGYLASKIKLEEDVSKMIPSDEKIEKINKVFQNSKFADKIVVNISLSDSNLKADPEKLIDFTNNLVDTLQKLFVPSHISEIMYKISDNEMFEVSNILYDYIPLFLDKTDYEKLDTLTSEKEIEASIRKNYKTLISPASIFMKKFIMRDPIGFTALGLNKLRSIQLDENFDIYDGYIVTKNRKNLLFFITSSNPTNETARNSELINGINNIITHLEEKFQNTINAEYFGSIAIGVGNAKRIKKDISLTVSFALLILILFISLFFRRKSVFLIIFLPALFGGCVSLAVLYLFKTQISAIALGVGSVLLGISVDYSLHFFTHYRNKGSITQVIRDLTTPILMSCLTTASAFLCLMFLRSEALQDLGLFAAISVISAALFSLIVLPHIVKLKNESPERLKGYSQLSFIDKFTSYRFDKNIFLVIIILIATFVFLFTFRRVAFESDISKLSYLSEDLSKAEQNLDKLNNYKLKSVYLVSSGKNLNDALKNNERVMNKIEHLKQNNIVKKYTNVSVLLLSDSMQQQKINSWNKFWTDAKRQEIRTRLINSGKKYKFKENAFEEFYNLLDKDFKPVEVKEFEKIRKLFLNEYITETEEMTTIVTLLKVDQKDKEKVYASFSDEENLTIFDKQYLTDTLIDILKLDFNFLIKISLLIVFGILLFSYGRIELAIITFLPMTISWLWTVGIMGVFGVKFNIFNIIISTFIFGLGIDYCIFIMRGLLQEYKYGQKNLSSYKTSIFLSALTTITGVGVLVFAKHPAMKSMAIFSMIGILSVLVISYTLEPILFRYLIITRKNKIRNKPMTFVSFIMSVIAFSIFVSGCLLSLIVGLLIFYLIPIRIKKKKYLFHCILMIWSKFQIYVMVNVKKVIINPNKEDFYKPSVIICNHQSFIDILLILMLHPKLIMLTNVWVQNSFFFGRIVKFADFYSVSQGIDKCIELLEDKVKDGYSIVVFPEGTRSATSKITRFHKGAFYIADKLKLDILPVMIHGSGDCISKNEILLNNGRITIKFLERIKTDDSEFGSNYTERAKLVGKYFRHEFSLFSEENETPKYFRDKLIKNYIYKGPVLEGYLKIKLKLEKNYELYHEIIPKTGKIIDIGCGFGFITIMLGFLSKNRDITGIDYDQNKINVANNCISKTDTTNFICQDILKYNFSKSDAFLLSDVLHYLPEEKQSELLINCIENLNSDGIILIRDADKSLKKRHFGTRYTEFFSTRFGFNKTEGKGLCFLSREKILTIAQKFGMNVDIIDNSTFTSNLFFIIRNNNNKIDNAKV